MEYGNILDKVKEYVSKYSIYIIAFLMVIILLIILIPKKNNKESNLTLTLKGNKEVSIMKGEEYVEAGYTAYDSIEGDITNKVIKIGIINENVVGSYIIKYKVTNKNGITKEEVRTINVVADLSDLSVRVSYPEELTNKDVTIELLIEGDGYDFAMDPDGNIIKSNKILYNAQANDEYIFSIKRKDGAVIEKIVSIENIDKVKPTGSCKNVINTNKTEISVVANDLNGIAKYSYNYNNKKEDSTSDKIVINEPIRNSVVTVYDKAGNYEMISCLTVDNSWPIMEHQNYTETTPLYYDQNGKLGKLNYIVYRPNDLDISNKNPLVIYLHGSGEFGTNIKGSFNENTTFVNNMKSGKFNQKAIFLAPQCNSSTKSWRKDCFNDLKTLIDDIVNRYNVDSNRISICGHSLGGGAVVDAIIKWPNFFSAAVLLAPASVTSELDQIKNIRIAVFTGTKDSLYGYSKNDVSKMQKYGVDAKFYPLEGKGHAAQPPVFNESNAIEWMISQSK